MWTRTKVDILAWPETTLWKRGCVTVRLSRFRKKGKLRRIEIAWFLNNQYSHRIDGPSEYSFYASLDEIRFLESLDDPALFDTMCWNRPRQIWWCVYGGVLDHKRRIRKLLEFPKVNAEFIVNEIKEAPDRLRRWLKIAKILKIDMGDFLNRVAGLEALQSMI